MMALAENAMKVSSASAPGGNNTDDDHQHSSSQPASRPPMCAGLSALILAATSQLGDLVDTDYGDGNASQVSHHSGSYVGDGYASSTSDGEHFLHHHNEAGGDHTLPEVLMTLLVSPDYADIITFLPDGKFFAIRQEEFSEQLMEQHFHVTSFQEFLDHMKSWGFANISGGMGGGESSTSDSGIQVFRHPHFRKGAGRDLRHVRFGGDSSQLSGLPAEQQVGIEQKVSEDSGLSSKRRLSPSHLTRDAEDQSLKTRAVEDNATDHDATPSSLGSYDSENPSRTVARRRSSTDARSIALAVTTAKLNIGGGEDHHVTELQKPSAQETIAPRRTSLTGSVGAAARPLEEGGVERVTQSIVTDAIETLLFDVGHTRETFLKHEKELGTSAFPNVVPISKQLFSEATEGASAQVPVLDDGGATMPPTIQNDEDNKSAIAPARRSSFGKK